MSDSNNESNSESIRQNIEHTRAELGETIDAMQERLSPAVLKERAQDAVRDATVGRAEEAVSDAAEAAKGAGARMREMIQENPIPAAMVGVGIGWLVMKSREGSHHRPASSGHESGNMTQQIGDMAGSGKEQAGRAVAEVQETAGEAMAQTTGQAQQLMRESPLIAGGVALALGAVAGLLLQPTEQENRLVGASRDRLVDQLKSGAKEAQEKVERVASEVQKTASEEARSQELTV